MKKCPNCAEEIREEAVKCRYCSSSLGAAASVARGSARPKKSRHAINMVCGAFAAALVLIGIAIALIIRVTPTESCDGSRGFAIDKDKKTCLLLVKFDVLEKLGAKQEITIRSILEDIFRPVAQASDASFVCDAISETCQLVSGGSRVDLDMEKYLKIRKGIADVGSNQEEVMEFDDDNNVAAVNRAPQTIRFLVSAGLGSLNGAYTAINSEMRGALLIPGDAIEITVLTADGSNPRLRIEMSKLAFKMRKSYDPKYSQEILFVKAVDAKVRCEKDQAVCKTTDLEVAASRLKEFLKTKMTVGQDLFFSFRLAAGMKSGDARVIRLITEGEANFVVETGRIAVQPQFGKAGQDAYASWKLNHPGGIGYVEFMTPLVNSKIDQQDGANAVCLYTVNRVNVTPDKDVWSAERDAVLSGRLCRNEKTGNQ